MMSKPSPNILMSSDGWHVEVLGLTGIKYVDATGSYLLDSELLHGEPIMVVIEKSISREGDAGSRSNVSLGKRRRIMHRIRSAFMWDGHEISVV